MTAPILPPTVRAPDLEGPLGRAWCSPPVSSTSYVLATWLLERQKAHPWACWWTLALLELSDETPEAPSGHLLYLAAVDPLLQSAPQPDREFYPAIYPYDVTALLVGLQTVRALEFASTIVLRVIMGTLSPERDGQAEWREAMTALARDYGGRLVGEGKEVLRAG